MEQLCRVAHDQEMTKRGGWNNWVGWHFAVNRGRLIRFIDAHGLYLVVDNTQIKIHNASVLIIFIIHLIK